MSEIVIEEVIKKAALKVFISKGYESTSMSDIAKEAGIGRTALHYYYRTKLILFDTTICDFADLLLPNIAGIANREGNIIDKIPNIVNAYYALLKENPTVPLFIVNELNRDASCLVSAITKDNNRIRPIIELRQQLEEQMEDGIVRKREIIDILSTFLSVVVLPFTIRKPMISILGDNADFMERKKNDAIEILTTYMKPIK
ncbi:MAG: helix-turn-helix domain-containing protein [Rikenellaceae bacterium]